MASLFTQPTAHRFGLALQQLLASATWKEFHAAVAWVRRSGTQHLLSSLASFLKRGAKIRLVVGIDIENTSKEGLEDLLALEAHGDMETVVYHNESGTTFHPKLYYLKGNDEACLIVGSNNLTEAGLFNNTEASLQYRASKDEPVFSQTENALEAWSDTNSGFALRLTAHLIEDLLAQKYVFTEAALKKTSSNSSNNKKTSALFKYQKVTAPHSSTDKAASTATKQAKDMTAKGAQQLTPGTVLLMRVRRASATARRTQIQLPKSVVDTKFFSGVSELESSYDGRKHKIGEATARGIVNTLKVEVPEIDPMQDPVLRLERTEDGITYEAFDSSTAVGKTIMKSLKDGFSTTPPQTRLTLPSAPENSTWWRFI